MPDRLAMNPSTRATCLIVAIIFAMIVGIVLGFILPTDPYGIIPTTP